MTRVANHHCLQESHGDRRSEYTAERIGFWDAYARDSRAWEKWRRYYRRQLSHVHRFLIPPGARVLELGCGWGDLLADLKPSRGVGVDFAPAMIEKARSAHPELHFVEADASDIDLGETFDYIICSDLVNDAWDVQRIFENVARHSHPGTRIILNFYSHLWEWPRRWAELIGIAKPQLRQNWLTVDDIANLCYLTGMEVLRGFTDVLCPLHIPLLGTLANRYLVRILPFKWFALTNFVIARPLPAPATTPPLVSVIVPARNEAGNIKQIFDRVPVMGSGTELVFVEGHSRDDTYQRIEEEMAARPSVPAALYRQTGEGKGDAVRVGFAKANGDLLMILDADLTVPPEDLPRFYEAWCTGRGDLINGVRLVYPMEEQAMRVLNFLGNKFFSVAFAWLLGQNVKDTLCGTKALSRRDYDMIARNRSYFGGLDPFGDFDLIFGAAKYNLKIVDLPVRYRERTYGQTNIRRWSHGWLLLRMVALGLRRLKFI